GDADKMSPPSLAGYVAGVTICSPAIASGADSPRAVKYEKLIIDNGTGVSRFQRIYTVPGNIHAALTQQGTGFLSAVKNSGLTKYQNGPAVAAMTSSDPGYVIAGVDDLTIRADITSADGITYFHAQAALRTHLALHPEDQ